MDFFHQVIVHTIMIQEYREKSEIDELVVLIREIWREYYVPIIGTEQVEYMLASFQSPEAISLQITEENYRYYGVLSDGELAGYYASRNSGDGRVFLSKFYVAARFRGHGFGKEMFQHFIDNALHTGAKKIWLTVNKYNQTVDLYRKLGFIITEEVVTDIGKGFVMDDYVMEKTIA